MKTRKLLAFLISIAVLVVTAISVTVLAEGETYQITYVDDNEGVLEPVFLYQTSEGFENFDVEKAEPGQKVIVRMVSHDNEYVADKCAVKTDAGTKVACSEFDRQVYDGETAYRAFYFTMPSKNVTVEVTAKPMDTLQVHLTPADANPYVCAVNVTDTSKNVSSSIGRPVSISEDGTYTYKYDKAYHLSTLGSELHIGFMAEGYYDYVEYTTMPDDGQLYVNMEKVVPIKEINTVDDLLEFGKQISRGYHFKGDTVKLNADLDLSGVRWIPLGDKYRYGVNGNIIHFTTAEYFSGTFEGQGHTIANMNMVFHNGDPDLLDGGFFKSLQDATVKDLVFKNPVIDASGTASYSNISYGWGTGVLAGAAWRSSIQNITVENPSINLQRMDRGTGGLIGFSDDCKLTDCVISGGSLTSKDAQTGGMIGFAYTTDMTRCGSSMDVIIKPALKSPSNFGGLIGGAVGGTLSQCYCSGDVTVQYNTSQETQSVGGLIGAVADTNMNRYKEEPATVLQITDCYTTGNVKGQRFVGGLIGYVNHSNEFASAESMIQNCYASGSVSGTASVGGLFGSISTYTKKPVNSSFDLKKVYSIDQTVTASDESGQTGQIVGTFNSQIITLDGKGLTAKEGSDWSTFADAGWSSNVWSIAEPYSYPVLKAFQNDQAEGLVLSSSLGDTLTSSDRTKLKVTGGEEGYQYRFVIKNNDTKNEWSPWGGFRESNSFEWYAGPAGAKDGKTITVYVKDAKGNDVATLTKNVTVTDAVLTIDQFTCSNQNPACTDTVKLSASVSGGSGSYQYQFRVVNNNTGTKYTIQQYKENGKTCNWWAGPKGGSKTVYVDVKDMKTGETVTRQMVVGVSDSKLKIDSITLTPKALTADTTATLKANIKNAPNGLKYRFYVYNNDTGKLWQIQSYKESNSCQWYAGPAGGSKTLYVDVKDGDTITSLALNVNISD